MKRARNRNKKTRKQLMIFFASFLSVLAIFFVALGIYGAWLSFFDSGDVIKEDYVEPVDKATGKANALILGVDKDGLRTDVIIVASYDLDNDKIDMLNIPRDTRMYIGNKYQKINAAHSLTQNGKIKGPQGTIEAVTRLTGIPINYYIEFSFDAFKKTIDALGGVEFDVPQRMKYSDPAQDLYIDLQPGLQLLDGDKAEQFVRFRKYPLGDIARVEAQQKFIKALAEQKLNLSIIERIPELYKVLKDELTTNLTMIDIMKYLPNIKELSADAITMHQLPGNFSGAEYTASYWLPDIPAIKLLVSETFGYDAAAITADSNNKKAVENDKKSTDKATPAPKTSARPSAAPTVKPTAAPAATPKASVAPSESPTPTPKPSIAPTATPEPIDIPDITETTAPGTPKPTASAKPEDN